MAQLLKYTFHLSSQKHVCKAEKARGRQLLTTLAGLFVSNSVKDIELNIRDVELGWKVKDGKTRVGGNNDKKQQQQQPFKAVLRKNC